MSDSYDDKFGIIIGLIVAISIAAIAIVVLGHMKFQEDRWNHGQCNNCGREWRFEQAVGHGRNTTYLYVCDDCLNTIEIGEYRGN